MSSGATLASPNRAPARRTGARRGRCSVGLTGSFKETSFADLMQFYAVSKQTVALKVQLEQGGATDGVFFFANGDLVGASLAGIEGREAVRRALRLREGVFTVEVGARPPAPGVAETRSEEHTSELQSRENLVCRLLLEKKK